jgi:dienelactone hydrolase
MLAFPAKWLDRLIIRMAAKNVRRSAKVSSRAAAAEIEPVNFFSDASTATPQVSFSGATAFRFPSAITTPSDENNIVHGFLFRCGQNWRSQPTVILIHGWSAELCYRFQFPRLARRLRRAGLNTATLELPYHCQRRPRRGGAVNDFISDDLNSMLQAARQALSDMRTLTRWLREQGSQSVGLWGFSLGAWLAGLAICADDQFDFAALLTPVVKVDRAIAELDFCEPIRRGLGQNKVPLAGLDLLAHRPKIPAEKILLIESKHDIFVPAETVEELWRVWGGPEIWRVNQGHISIMMSPSVLKRAVNWIGHAAILDRRSEPVQPLREH